METRIEEFLRWLEGRGIVDERLLEYRECAEELLGLAHGGPVEAAQVDAARQALAARGARPRTLARLEDTADALRRYQRPAAPGGPASLRGVATASAPPAAAPATAPAAAPAPRPGSLRGTKLVVAAGVSVVVLAAWIGGVYHYFTRPLAADGSSLAVEEEEIERSPEEKEIQRVYQEFHTALHAGNAQQLRTLLAADKLADLSGPDAEAKLALAKSFYPEKVDLGRAEVRGASAVLHATGHVGEQRAKGRIELTKHDDAWKVGNVEWKLTFGEEKPERKRRKIARPADLPKLRGRWQGKETASGTSWTLVFSDDDRLSAESSRGDRYAGDVVIRWDLGVEGGTIHVPPGWGPLDVEVDEASATQEIGKVALGAFTVSTEELKLCGGPPGLGTRVRSFEDPGSQFRCLVLTKVGGDATEAAPTAAAQEPEAPGYATLTLDGVSERYELETRFYTRLAKPEEATMQFQVKAPEHSNARRIVLTLDATHVGSHYADANSIHNEMFADKPVAIGRSSGGEWSASLKWIADGGQNFPPKTGTRCEIRVTSRYTGSEDGEFSAEIPRCVVHSAGIDHTLADVKLTIRGKLER